MPFYINLAIQSFQCLMILLMEIKKGQAYYL